MHITVVKEWVIENQQFAKSHSAHIYSQRKITHVKDLVNGLHTNINLSQLYDWAMKQMNEA